MTDHEIYARGGQALLDGARLYTDFIDVKPPLIYELFAACIAVFGASTVALRSMEVCLHLVTLVLIFRMVYRHTGSRLSAHSATIAFGMYIASLGVPTSLQPETMAFLPILLIIRIGVKKSVSWSDAAALGVVSGILFTLKYPFVLAAVPVIWTIVRQAVRPSRLLTIIIISFTCVVALVFGIVWYDGIIPAMQQIAVFLTGYASTYESIPKLVAGGLDVVSDFIANDTSLLLTTLALTAVIGGMLRGGKRDPLFVVTVTVLVMLVVSIIVERKFNLSHMPRIIPAMAILIGYGFPIVWRACTRAWRDRTFSVPVFVAMAFIVIILSPLPRVARSTGGVAKAVVQSMSHRADPNTYHHGFVDLFGMDSAIAAVKRVQPRSLVVLGVGGTVLYWYVPGVRKSKFATAHFFTSRYAPSEWNSEALREATEADVIALQNDDAHPRLAGHAQTTREVLMSRPAWAAMFATRQVVFDDGDMSVWVRR